MSTFFAILFLLATISVVVFLIRYLFKKNKKDLRNMGISFAVLFLSLVLGPATMTTQEKANAATRRASEAAEAERKEAIKAAEQSLAKEAEKYTDVDPTTDITPSDVEVACEHEVKTLLKLPDTARFPDVMQTEEATVDLKLQIGYWSSWVEAENDFGGTVRKYYSCKYTHPLMRAEITFKYE